MEHGKRRRSATHTAEYRYLLNRLKEGRRRAGLTQLEVARALGRPQSYVTKCELGERRIDPVELQQYARIYRRPLSYFLPPLSSKRHR